MRNLSIQFATGLQTNLGLDSIYESVHVLNVKIAISYNVNYQILILWDINIPSGRLVNPLAFEVEEFHI